MKQSSNRPQRVLIVEDNPGDVRLIREAFAEANASIETVVAKDGVEALDYLSQHGTPGAEDRPDLMLLDLNLPRKSGHEVLTTIKADDSLKQIPVVVFSSSAAPKDVVGAYRLRANCYVTKPSDLDELFSAIAQISRFWFVAVRLPGTAIVGSALVGSSAGASIA